MLRLWWFWLTGGNASRTRVVEGTAWAASVQATVAWTPTPAVVAWSTTPETEEGY